MKRLGTLNAKAASRLSEPLVGDWENLKPKPSGTATSGADHSRSTGVNGVEDEQDSSLSYRHGGVCVLGGRTRWRIAEFRHDDRSLPC